MINILTTTTNTLEGWTIKEYLQPISSNIVVGANIFSDITASWTDFFGGRSTSYEKKLQDIYQQAIANLRNKAKTSGANCIVGLKIDIDEISGKGSQMFMITAIGTPVRAVKDGETLTAANIDKNIIDGNYVENKVKANRLISKYYNIDTGFNKSIQAIAQEEIDFILDSRLPELHDLVINAMKHLSEGLEDNRLKKLKTYFGMIEPSTAIDLLYKQLLLRDLGVTLRWHFNSVIIEFDLIDLDHIQQLLESDNRNVARSGLKLLGATKSTYTSSDLDKIESIHGKLKDRFPMLGNITTRKKILSSSEREVWVCPCGGVNDLKIEYCESCQKDIYGFTLNEVKVNDIISTVERRVEVLREMV